MAVLVGVLVVWAVLGFVVAVVVGRGIRLADVRAAAQLEAMPLTTADLPDGFTLVEAGR